MSERANELEAALARHVSSLCRAATAVIHRAQILAGRSADDAAIRVLMADVSFKHLDAWVRECNAWLREQAERVGAVQASASERGIRAEDIPPLGQLFADPVGLPDIGGRGGNGHA